MRKINRPYKRRIGLRFLKEGEYNRDRALAVRRPLTIVQNKSVLRGGLEGIKFPIIIWLGYMIGLQRGG